MIAEQIAVLQKHLANTPPALIEGTLVAEKGLTDENGLSKVTVRCVVVIGPRPDAEHESLVKELGD